MGVILSEVKNLSLLPDNRMTLLALPGKRHNAQEGASAASVVSLKNVQDVTLSEAKGLVGLGRPTPDASSRYSGLSMTGNRSF